MCNKNNAAATGHRNLFFLPDFTAQHFLSYSSRSTCLFLSYPPPAATSQWEMQINKSSAVGKFSLVDLINPEIPRCSNPECTPGAINNYLQKGIIPSKLEVAPPPKCGLDGWVMGDTP